MNILVQDNFLNDNDFFLIRDTLLGESFPWYYNDYKTFSKISEDKYLDDFQFTHNFYDKYCFQSSFSSILNPILEKINPISILRIKANLTLRTKEIIEYGYHVDHDNFYGKTAIFYVNSNDGMTIFENGEKISSVSNRLVIFDSQERHSGTSCVNFKNRCLINFNFFEK